MQDNPKKLTSVRVDEDLYLEFRTLCIKDKFSFSKLVSHSIFLYIKDKQYREQIIKTEIND
jgi:hypothetical protein